MRSLFCYYWEEEEEHLVFSIKWVTWGKETPGCVIKDAILARVCR
jgi:hypothetical protein